MALKLITPAAVEPIGLEEAENFLRIDSEPDVTMITDMIITARKQAENITGRQLITATWEWRLDHFPGGCGCGGPFCRDHRGQMLEVPKPPLQAVVSLKYLDAAGEEQPLTEGTDFVVDTYAEPARIAPAYGCQWPSTQPVFNAVRLQFIAGYGDADTDVPEPIRNWLKVVIGALFENRELAIVANVTQALTKLEFLDGLLDDYRIWRF